MLPCSVYLTGQYGINDIYIGCPCILGRNGVEKVIELKLSEQEIASLRKSAEIYKDQVKLLG